MFSASFGMSASSASSASSRCFFCAAVCMLMGCVGFIRSNREIRKIVGCSEYENLILNKEIVIS